MDDSDPSELDQLHREIAWLQALSSYAGSWAVATTAELSQVDAQHWLTAAPCLHLANAAREADATMAAPAWIPHTAPLALPLAPLLADSIQPLVLGVLLPRFALMVFAGDLGVAALRGSLSPVSLALRLVALIATGAALLLVARSMGRQLRRSATDSEGSC